MRQIKKGDEAMSAESSILRIWTLRAAGLAAGVAAALLFACWESMPGLHRLLALVYEKVGITILALLPLSIWAVRTALKAGAGNNLTLSYIGTTAQRVGLLGTVIGIVAATLSIGDNLSAGAANAVTGALPAVGQALVSTAVGFVIAIACDFFRYINMRDSKKE